MRAKLRERGFPAERDRPVRLRALGGQASSTAWPAACCSDEIHPGLRPRALQRRRRPPRASGRRSSSRPAPWWSTTPPRSARDPEIPLVVAEVNPEALEGHKGLIANPNCSTMQLMVALKPIHDAAGIDRLVVSTYQSVSGTGVKAVRGARGPDARRAGRRAAARRRDLSAPHRVQRARRRRQLRRRRRPHRRRAQDDVRDAQDPRRRGHQDRRHLRARAGAQLALGVGEPRDPRGPVGRGRARAAGGDARADAGRRPGRHGYPTALAAAGHDEVFVGRLRRDPTHPRGLQLWVVSDNLLKGAATNAVQIAEVLHARGLVQVPAAA